MDSTLSATADAGILDMLQVVPNPAEDFFMLRWNAYSDGDLTLALRNTQGVVVQTKHLQAPDGLLEVPLSVGNLPKGMYWLELQTARGAFQKKLVLH